MENANASQGGKLTFCTKNNITCVKFDCGMGEGGGGGSWCGGSQNVDESKRKQKFLSKILSEFCCFCFY